MPAIVEADDGDLYVMKFVAAGQGRKALIAELIAGEIGRALGLRVPGIVLMHLDPALGRSEPHQEIREVLQRSGGLNLAMRYLPHALTFSNALKPAPDAALASAIVWFDAYVTNVDRTPRNVNILIWQDALWLIDHGASLYFHHNWPGYLERSRTPFPMIKDHTLLALAGALPAADAAARARLTPPLFADIVAQIPDAWLDGEPAFANAAEHRQAYVAWLSRRLEATDVFVEEALDARSKLV